MIENSLQHGYPISLSRWTDVAHWYLPWLEEAVLRKGFLVAPDPVDIVPKKWSLDPDKVSCLVFWTKHPEALIRPLRTWLLPFRTFVIVTVNDWPEVEPRVPDLSTQLQGLRGVTEILGPSSVRLRYSPVPVDFLTNTKRQDSLEGLLELAEKLGLEREIDVSLLQSDTPSGLSYAESRKEILSRIGTIASSRGFRAGICAEDLVHLPYVGEAFFETACLDIGRLRGLFPNAFPTSRRESSCRCAASLDPCLGPQFGCGSGCSYCYAPYTAGLNR